MAQDLDADLPEYVGADKSTRADPPKGKRNSTSPAVTASAPSVAVYTPPAPGSTHPREPKLAPAKRLDAAEEALRTAQTDLMSARGELTAAQAAESEAELAFASCFATISPDELLRQHAARAAQERAERVARGETPEAKPAPTHNRSPVDVAAASRPKTNRQAPSTPLRSNVIRR
ncbi:MULTISPECIES: hypothetical protein [Bradyrhizobium]|jgi:hypothetical protein|uniref:Uncharacterized protein n=2 Tax=Bradyrhizobium TaxID=374 RepID=A0ABY0PJV6_9BRAD|nr:MULTISPECIES: hypothetical protein [Bradyrhizobium]SDI54545.1 hypothetical protein SAMN05444163_3088 [Bradyrhizobium ottawaense]SED42914.1 hypothetical protein SAMN05444171_4081 [Bradyrhizobium lablabi]